MMPAALSRGVPVWALVVLGIVGGGGGVTSLALVGTDLDKDVDALREHQMIADHDRQQLEARAVDLERRDAEQDKDIAAIEAKAMATELRLLRQQNTMSRWMVDVMVKHSGALEAIAAKLHVEVDVRVPMYSGFELEEDP